MRASKLKSLKLLIFCHLDAILDNHNGDLFRHFQCGKVVVKFEACRVCLDLEGKKKSKFSPSVLKPKLADTSGASQLCCFVAML